MDGISKAVGAVVDSNIIDDVCDWVDGFFSSKATAAATAGVVGFVTGLFCGSSSDEETTTKKKKKKSKGKGKAKAKTTKKKAA